MYGVSLHTNMCFVMYVDLFLLVIYFITHASSNQTCIMKSIKNNILN
jgi:hypothetical protein